MKFYKQYPMMRPYVGKKYWVEDKPSLLLIGESHYLPESSQLDTTSELWYAGNSSMLSEDESAYCSTEQLIEDARNKEFSNKSHSIWRNSLLVINEFGPAFPDFTRLADDIAFYNFFLRPAAHKVSLRVTPQDVDIANEAFNEHIDKLKPSAIIFLSRLALNHFWRPQALSTPIIGTPHPGCKWWNRAAKRYNDRKGKEVLADFIKTTIWPKIASSNDVTSN